MVSLGEEQEEQPTSEKKKKNYVNKVEHLLKYYSTSKDVDFTVDALEQAVRKIEAEL